uniref:Uncharacterized protein n=1 Tax=Timspurckia oligopyrenoides TaxID=708627 RepID=A0A7S0ZGK4_9RHOD|mmetsp:Transcript_419/g.766  ORF Transcript_419/g.766 Transcript_419/m.766 type:complete len:121 (+) Transcript_419:144-506(+)|eukprot:CAMPEP_0182441122 /NCGR_PEP_ID=MMETSP1172-20130603/73_1 /TAXON_ID=708627 /ORGANISM="Timspurckia oligopyrenoides, Strain CCMP3278" /LENGTH=120 /DNA_ID=CAMNT_0024635275 /DNA_START=89 /DNA_END=451 /DNA_ORIENTATION=-
MEKAGDVYFGGNVELHNQRMARFCFPASQVKVADVTISPKTETDIHEDVIVSPAEPTILNDDTHVVQFTGANMERYNLRMQHLCARQNGMMHPADAPAATAYMGANVSRYNNRMQRFCVP